MNKTTPYTIYAACVCMCAWLWYSQQYAYFWQSPNAHYVNASNLCYKQHTISSVLSMDFLEFHLKNYSICWHLSSYFLFHARKMTKEYEIKLVVCDKRWRNMKRSLYTVANDDGIREDGNGYTTEQQPTHTQKKIRWRNKKICINCYLGVCCLCATIATSGTNARTEKKEAVEGVNMGKRALWIIE